LIYGGVQAFDGLILDAFAGGSMALFSQTTQAKNINGDYDYYAKAA
jgi:hypothetical protein